LTANEPFCCLMFEICNNKKVSDSKMRNFFDEQGRTRISVKGTNMYVADGNPRRTPLIEKRTIYEWKLRRLYG